MAIDKKLALQFIESVDRAQDEIVRFPKIGRASGKYRALGLKKFPYNYCYREDLDGELVAIVLFHHKQKEPRID
jgi:plasmid stabilization system protein ParE